MFLISGLLAKCVASTRWKRFHWIWDPYSLCETPLKVFSRSMGHLVYVNPPCGLGWWKNTVVKRMFFSTGEVTLGSRYVVVVCDIGVDQCLKVTGLRQPISDWNWNPYGVFGRVGGVFYDIQEDSQIGIPKIFLWTVLSLGGVFFIFFCIFIPTWGDDSIWWAYFSTGLKSPTRFLRGLF